MANDLTVSATHDYRLESIGVVDTITFSTLTSFPTATFNQSQLSTSLGVTPDSNYDHIVVFVTTAAFSAAGWSLPSWAWGLISIEGTAGAETITGSSSFNVIHGGDGADWLFGGNGGNTFSYLAGSEIAVGEALAGGTGIDELNVGNGSYGFSAVALSSIEDLRIDNFSSVTRVSFNGSQVRAGAINSVIAESDVGGIALTVSGPSVDLSAVTFVGWNATAIDSITVIGTAGADILIGSSQDDRINGLAGADILRGGPGNDLLRGGPGADRMIGGDGDDGYFVDNAGDVVRAGLGALFGDGITSSVSFNLSDPVHCTGIVFVLTLIGTGNINGTGNASANFIIGNGGSNVLAGRGSSDTLFGRGRSDLLAGGPGNDTLAGGPGNDGFRFDAALNAAANLDHVTDFVHLHDRIILKHPVFAAIPAGALPSGAFHQGTHAGDADDRIVYDRPQGGLYYDPDGSGAHAQVQFAVLDNQAVLTGADFLVV